MKVWSRNVKSDEQQRTYASTKKASASKNVMNAQIAKKQHHNKNLQYSAKVKEWIVKQVQDRHSQLMEQLEYSPMANMLKANSNELLRSDFSTIKEESAKHA